LKLTSFDDSKVDQYRNLAYLIAIGSRYTKVRYFSNGIQLTCRSKKLQSWK